MTSWWLKDWTRPYDDLITMPDPDVMGAVLGYLADPAPGVVSAVRVPLCASYWLDVCTDDTCDWADARATYPGLAGQYRTLVSRMVETWTQAGVAVILDLHHNDDTYNTQVWAEPTRARHPRPHPSSPPRVPRRTLLPAGLS